MIRTVMKNRRSWSTLRIFLLVWILLIIPLLYIFSSSPSPTTSTISQLESTSTLLKQPSYPKIKNIESQNIPKKSRPMKYIVFWTSFFGDPTYNFGLGQEPFITEQCPINECTTTNNRRMAEKADALIFHFNDFNPNHVPAVRTANQLYGFFSMESVVNSRNLASLIPENFFNISMTYRLDSDIPLLYGRISEKNKSSVEDTLQTNYFQTKSKLCAWFVSNCNTQSNRESYVEQLKKHMKIDIYGNCGPLKCPRGARKCNGILQKYKFYLAFENSLCPDYVTEKFYRAFENDVIPVVFGGADYSKFAPPHSYINARKFASPKKLAEYLLLVSKDEVLYNEYFQWKQNFKFENNMRKVHTFCQLCAMIHNESYTRTYDNFKNWWFNQNKCEDTSNRV